MFVVVYLLKAGVRIIIPEEFIHDLCEQTLKNIGCNSNHKYLIYWSKNVIGDGTYVPNPVCAPNFTAPLSDDYPPQNDAIEACYIAQLKHFFNSFEEAKMFRDKFRAQKSAVYNIRRLDELPIPSLQAAVEDDLVNSVDDEIDAIVHDVLDSDIQHDESADEQSIRVEQNEQIFESQSFTDEFDAETVHNDDSQNNVTQDGRRIPNEVNDIEENQPVHNENSRQTDSIEHTEFLSSETVENVDTHREETIDDDNYYGAVSVANVSEQSNSVHDSEKPQFEPVHVEDDDSSAFSDLFDAAATILTLNLDPSERAVVGEKGQIKITKSLGDGEEFTYIYGKVTYPRNPLYEVKLNDLVTGNIPFKENVNKDRAYLVRVDGIFKEVKFSAQLVKGLSLFNEPIYRSNDSFDKPFIKALVIGICTIQKIKEEGRAGIHKDLLLFIREIFMMRIENSDEDGKRYLAFNSLVTSSCNDIIHNDFS